MSDEQNTADLATVEQMRARILEWEDCYDRLAGAFELHMDILECKQALSDLAGSYYDVMIGGLGDELLLLRELFDDVARWREGGGDPRDLRYIIDTMDKIDATKGTDNDTSTRSGDTCTRPAGGR